MSLVDTTIDADDCFLPRVPLGHRRSSSLPLMTSDVSRSINRSSLSYYSKLPEEPLKLFVLKLDGSSFEIEVMRSATVAELKEAVEAVFSYVPRNGPGRISWVHVWGHFCLCYNGQMLVEDRDHIRNYGIRDGDQLEFIQHVSPKCYSPSKSQSIKWISSPRKQKRSLSRSSRHEEKHRDDNDDLYDGTENGRHHPLDEMDYSIVQDDKMGRLFKQRFVYSRLPTMQRMRSLTNSPSRSTNGFFVHIKRMMLLCGVNHYSQRDVLREG